MKTLITAIQSDLGITADGIAGPLTLAAIAADMDCPANWASVQEELNITADGIAGPKTITALARKMNLFFYPTKSEITSGKSIFGKAGDESQLVSIKPPYQLFYDGQPLSTIRVHREIADSVVEALTQVLEHYGADRIRSLKLDQYDGCYNNRTVRGGTATSMHAWGIAIDWCAAKNGNNMGPDQALFAGDEYIEWFNIWESVGARSFGRRNKRDYMHVEFISPTQGNDL